MHLRVIRRAQPKIVSEGAVWSQMVRSRRRGLHKQLRRNPGTNKSVSASRFEVFTPKGRNLEIYPNLGRCCAHFARDSARCICARDSAHAISATHPDLKVRFGNRVLCFEISDSRGWILLVLLCPVLASIIGFVHRRPRLSGKRSQVRRLRTSAVPVDSILPTAITRV